MSEERIIISSALTDSKPFTANFTNRLVKRRLILFVCAAFGMVASSLTLMAALDSKSMMMMVLFFLFIERTAASILSLFDNVVMSNGIFSTRFPTGLGRVELRISFLFAGMIIVFGVYLLWWATLGNYNLDEIDVGKGRSQIIMASVFLILGILIQHFTGMRNLSSKSEVKFTRLEILPLLVPIIGLVTMAVTGIEFIDPMLTVLISIYFLVHGISLMSAALREYRIHSQKDYTYRRLCAEISKRFGGEVLSARMKRQMDQRFCRVKIEFDKELGSRSEMSRKIELFLLDEFDLDKALVQVRMAVRS